MKEIEIQITELSKICGFSKGLIRQYCSSYKLSKWIKRKCKPMTFLLNDESVKAFQEYLTQLDNSHFISLNTRLTKFNKGIKLILKTVQSKQPTFYLDQKYL